MSEAEQFSMRKITTTVSVHEPRTLWVKDKLIYIDNKKQDVKYSY